MDQLYRGIVKSLCTIGYNNLLEEWWRKSRELYSEEDVLWEVVADNLSMGKLILGTGKDDIVLDLLISLYQARHQIPVEKAREIYLPFLAKGEVKAFLFYFFFDRSHHSPELTTFLSLPYSHRECYVREKILSVKKLE